MFVCVEVLRPSQPNGVMSSAVSLPNHTFTGVKIIYVCFHDAEQKRVRVQICRGRTNQYSEGGGLISRIVTYDEIWFYFFEPESKQMSTVLHRHDL